MAATPAIKSAMPTVDPVHRAIGVTQKEGKTRAADSDTVAQAISQSIGDFSLATALSLSLSLSHTHTHTLHQHRSSDHASALLTIPNDWENDGGPDDQKERQVLAGSLFELGAEERGWIAKEFSVQVALKSSPLGGERSRVQSRVVYLST